MLVISAPGKLRSEDSQKFNTRVPRQPRKWFYCLNMCLNSITNSILFPNIFNISTANCVPMFCLRPSPLVLICTKPFIIYQAILKLVNNLSVPPKVLLLCALPLPDTKEPLCNVGLSGSPQTDYLKMILMPSPVIRL